MNDYQQCLLRAFGETEYGAALVAKIEALYPLVKADPGIAELLKEVRTDAMDESAAFFLLFSYDYFPRTFAALKAV